MTGLDGRARERDVNRFSFRRQNDVERGAPELIDSGWIRLTSVAEFEAARRKSQTKLMRANVMRTNVMRAARLICDTFGKPVSQFLGSKV